MATNISQLIEDMNNTESKKYGYIKDAEGKPSFVSNPDIATLRKELYTDMAEPFEYDKNLDPEYSPAKKEYIQEADRTMRDVLAQGAVKTGGIASTAAVTAASEARDYQASKFFERENQLYENAYAKKQAENNAKLQLLEAMQGMEDAEYNKYLYELNRVEEAAEKEKAEAQDEVSRYLAMNERPPADVLAKSGISPEYVDTYMNYVFGNMSTEEMQRYLYGKGLLGWVDGIWGPNTENAYQQVFGKPSGRYNASTYAASYGGSYGGSGSGGGSRKYVPSPTPTLSEYEKALKNIQSGNYSNKTAKAYVDSLTNLTDSEKQRLSAEAAYRDHYSK